MPSDTASETRPLGTRTLVALCVLNHTALAGGRVALALQALSLGMSSLALGLLLAPFALTSTLCSLPFGRWVDRVGARVPALAGMATSSLGLALGAWQPGPAGLVGAAVLVGLGYTAALIALQSELARDRDEAARATGFSAFAIGTAASGGLGPFIAGQCAAHAGARVAFAVLAAISLASTLAGALRARRLGSRPQAAAPMLSRQAGTWALTRGNGGLRRILFADLLMAFAWNANGFVVPLLGERHHWPADTVGNLLATFGIAVMLVRTVPAGWRARGGDWPTIGRAIVASGCVLALLPFAAWTPAPYLLELLLGCGLGCALPAVLALVHAQTPPGRAAEILGLRQAVLSLGAATLPTGLGALIAAAGLAGALGGFGGTLLAAAATIVPRAARQPARAVDRR